MDAKTIIMLLKNLMLMTNSISSLNFLQQPDQYLEILDEIERYINLVLLVSSVFYSHGWIYIYRTVRILFKIFLIIGGWIFYCLKRLSGDLISIEAWLDNFRKQAPMANIQSSNLDFIPQVDQQEQEFQPITQAIHQEPADCGCKKNGNLKFYINILIFI